MSHGEPARLIPAGKFWGESAAWVCSDQPYPLLGHLLDAAAAAGRRVSPAHAGMSRCAAAVSVSQSDHMVDDHTGLAKMFITCQNIRIHLNSFHRLLLVIENADGSHHEAEA